jgi:hypothetical protein
MKILLYVLCSLLLTGNTVSAAPSVPPKIRPYAGIGIVLMPVSNAIPPETYLLYNEPALQRSGELNSIKLPTFDWIFGTSSTVRPLIVMGRKGTWLKVAYDDAGREAWLNPPRKLVFQTWDLFFKGNVSRLLPGLHKKYYQVYQQPDSLPLLTLTATQQFKALQIENDWAMVLVDQSTLGWLRWRDEDGRLVIGIVTEPKVKQP